MSCCRELCVSTPAQARSSKRAVSLSLTFHRHRLASDIAAAYATVADLAQLERIASNPKTRRALLARVKQVCASAAACAADSRCKLLCACVRACRRAACWRVC